MKERSRRRRNSLSLYLDIVELERGVDGIRKQEVPSIVSIFRQTPATTLKRFCNIPSINVLDVAWRSVAGLAE